MTFKNFLLNPSPSTNFLFKNTEMENDSQIKSELPQNILNKIQKHSKSNKPH